MRNRSMTSRFRSSSRPRSLGFTLIELLVAMAIIAIIGGITVVAIRTISEDARISSGTNAVTTALSTARSLAMAENKLVLVVFRPRLDEEGEQFVEMVFCEWSGETAGTDNPIVDRFVPFKDQPSFRLPKGVKVAFPQYGANDDDVWVTQLEIGAGEYPDFYQMSGIMYGPDGSVRTRNQLSDSNRAWVDFNEDRLMQIDGVELDPFLNQLGSISPPDQFIQHLETDEPAVNNSPFLAVYDDREARDRRATNWENLAQITTGLIGPNGFITNNATRIHFNRYTGVPMR